MRCPHCKSEVRVLFRAPEICPRCERSLRDGDGAVLREVDDDFEGLSRRLDERSLRRLKGGALICAALSVSHGLSIALPILLPLVPTVLVIQQIVWARPLIAAPYARHYSTSRRIVTRWLSRFFVFTLASLHLHGALPGGNLVAILASPVIFVVTCGTVRAYHRFHLQRERNREPVLLVEKILLIVGGLIAVLVLIGMVFFAMAFGELVKMFS